MPYKSDAQRRYFHAAAARGDIKKKTVHEFDEASKGKDLPEHVKKWMGGYADGGEVSMPPNRAQEPDEQSIEQYEEQHPYMSMPAEVRAKYDGYSDGGPVSQEEADKVAAAMGMPKPPQPPKPQYYSEGGEVRYDLDEHGMHEYLRDQVSPDMSDSSGSQHTSRGLSPEINQGYDREATVEPGDENGKPDADDALTRQEMLMELRRRKYKR